MPEVQPDRHRMRHCGCPCQRGRSLGSLAVSRSNCVCLHSDLHDITQLELDSSEFILVSLVGKPGVGCAVVFKYLAYFQSLKDRCLCILISLVELGLQTGIASFVRHLFEEVFGGFVTATATIFIYHLYGAHSIIF